MDLVGAAAANRFRRLPLKELLLSTSFLLNENVRLGLELLELLMRGGVLSAPFLSSLPRRRPARLSMTLEGLADGLMLREGDMAGASALSVVPLFLLLRVTGMGDKLRQEEIRAVVFFVPAFELMKAGMVSSSS